MRRVAMLLLAALCLGTAIGAQQPPSGNELTFWYEYTVKPGKEAGFMELVKTVGAPVRDKLMAEGVISGWGIETPLLRGSSINGTHLIWFSSNWAGVAKVHAAMAEQMAKLNAEDAKAAADKKSKPGMTLQQRQEDTLDMSKTRDWLTRDVVYVTSGNWAGATNPYFRYNFNKAKPGMGGAYRDAWEKYNKPVLDQLVKDGVIISYGLAVEEVKTSSDFTHFVWYGVKSVDAFDKIRAAFIADRAKRSQEERDAISAMFGAATEADAATSAVTQALIFKVRPQ